MKQNKNLVMIIDDEPLVQDAYCTTLQRSGFAVKTFSNAEDAQVFLRETMPGLILLDLVLPGMDGREFCQWLRRVPAMQNLPIIMLTGCDGEEAIVQGLSLGADDYLTKPITPTLLIARVRAVLRRRMMPAEYASTSESISVGGISLTPATHSITLDGNPGPKFTRGEFRALELLLRNPGIVFSRFQILECLHAGANDSIARAADVLMVGLRRKLGNYGNMIETVHGVGYRLVDVTQAQQVDDFANAPEALAPDALKTDV